MCVCVCVCVCVRGRPEILILGEKRRDVAGLLVCVGVPGRIESLDDNFVSRHFFPAAFATLCEAQRLFFCEAGDARMRRWREGLCVRWWRRRIIEGVV